MNDTTFQEREYRTIEVQVHEKHKALFDQLGQELRDEWTPVWKEQRFDVSKVKVRVLPRITLSLQEEGSETVSEKERNEI